MFKSNAANVIDLEAFRQRKMREERGNENLSAAEEHSAAMVVPVWFSWRWVMVPMWTPFVG